MTGIGYALLYSLPLSLLAAFLSSAYIAGEENRPLYLCISVLTALILTLLYYLRGRWRWLVFAVVAAFFAGLFLTRPSGTKLEFLRDHSFIFLGILLFALCFLFTELMIRFRILGILPCLAGFSYLIFCMLTRRTVEKAVVLLILFVIALSAADLRQRKTVREGDTEPKKHLLGVILFLAACFLVPAFIKPPEKPLDWSFVKEWSEAFKSRYAVLRQMMFHSSGWDETQSTIGFSDRGTVAGGNLSKDGYRVMEIRMDSPGGPVVYLAGGYFDTFDGKSWQKTDKEDVPGRTIDTLETAACALQTEEEIPFTDRMKKVTAQITYRGLRTPVLFAPSKLLPVNAGKKITVLNEGADVRFSKRRKTGEPYGVSFFRLNRDDEDFIAMLEAEHIITEEDWEKAVSFCGIKAGAGLSYEDYLAYKERIRKRDGESIVLSPELQSFLNDLTEGADTDYEKLERIERYLSALDYSVTPGIPEDAYADGTSFLDYFMLEKKEGYCSHYATAFVLMARSLGIPARYVEGYRVPVGKTNEAWVDSTMAHAWPEVYFDGIGWIPFEPTPGYLINTSWAHAKKYDPEAAKQMYLNREEEEETETAEEEQEEDKPRPLPDIRKILLFAFLFVAFILAVLGIAALQDRIRYRKLTEEEKIGYLCKRHMEFLKFLGIRPAVGETIPEFSGRLLEEHPEVPDLSGMFVSFEKILYSKESPEKEERTSLEQSRDALRRFLIGRMTKIRIFRRKRKTSL